MKKHLVYICDLTHTAQCVSSDFFPYGAACVGSFLQKYSKFEPEVELFKLPQDLEQKLEQRLPDAIAFSSYMWNSQLALQIARIIKTKYPQMPVIFGGTNFPDEKERKIEWLYKYPWIDFFIVKEGEIPFQLLMDELFTNGLEKTKATVIPNTASRSGDQYFIGDIAPRVQSLDDVPSPYLLGMMDKFMDQLSWVVTETNRGCPFRCAFCAEGDIYFNKVAKRDNSRIIQEIEYIAQNHGNAKMLFFADSNFIMFKENIEICTALADSQKKHGWPSFIGCSTGKNKKELVLQGTSILGNSITLAGSVQSLVPEVLKNVNRSNISTEAMMDVAEISRTSGTPTYTELIACLPGDTLETYKQSLKGCIESGIDIIKTHTLILLEGTELHTKEAREKFGLKTKLRPVSKSFGNYTFLNEKICCIETENLVYETAALPFKDYLECRRLQLTTQYFYNDNLFEEIQNVLKFLDLPVWDWLLLIHERINQATGNIKSVYDLFMTEINEELWDSEEELNEFIKTHMDDFLDGKRGNNVTFKFRALLLKQYLTDFIEIGFEVAASLLKSKNVDNLDKWLDYLSEQKAVALLRKKDIFDYSQTSQYVLKYQPLPSKKTPEMEIEKYPQHERKHVRILHTDAQRKMLEDHHHLHGQDILQLSALLNRVPARTFYRQMLPVGNSNH